MTIMLIGNKCDLEHRRQVSTEEGEAFAKKHHLMFLETSAKANTNVEQAFITMASEIKNSMPAGQMGSPGSGPKVTVGPSAAINSQNQGGCC